MRRTFGPTVLLGLAAGTLAAVAGAKAWVAPRSGDGQTQALAQFLAEGRASGELPVVTSLALVALACWGVLLVTRGRTRRVVVGLGALASVGAVVAVVASWVTLADQVRADLAEAAGTTVDVRHTAWSYAGSLGAVLLLGAWGVAVRAVGQWPEIGTRYDSPTGGPAEPATAPEGASSLDLWKAMDAGQDPTA